MPKIMTWRMAEAMRRGDALGIMAAIDHPDGMFRCWTGIGPLQYGGQPWTGIGILGQVAPIKRSTQMAVQDVTFSLSGVDQESIALLQDKIRNRIGTVWLFCMDKGGRVVPDPYMLLESELDYQKFSVSDDGTAVISIVGRSGFYTLERALNDVWSDEDQQKRYPGDTGLAMLAQLQNNQVLWTRS